ncbi:MAG: acyl-CoA desaturase, partial [Actinomycetes bacterium]
MTLTPEVQPVPGPATVEPVQINSRGMRITIGVFVVVPLLAVIAAIPVAWGGWLSWVDVILAFAFYLITAGGITLGYHR